MLIGFAGIFGGNTRPTPVSGARPASAIGPQTKSTTPFSPVLHEVTQPAPSPRQNHVAVGKSLAIADANLSPAKGLQLTTRLKIAPPTTTHTNEGKQAASIDTSTVIDTLKTALIQAGVDISGMEFSQHHDVVTYPGGSFVNDLISFQSASGRTHEYMANLTKIAPQVTVVEIQQLMAGNRG